MLRRFKVASIVDQFSNRRVRASDRVFGNDNLKCRAPGFFMKTAIGWRAVPARINAAVTTDKVMIELAGRNVDNSRPYSLLAIILGIIFHLFPARLTADESITRFPSRRY